ncbi:ATP-binding protein [Reichenbachiella versicolor]|uniref:ATP-binding protein n=1 Tax=Reichenbachiella versicolor TaxID=1821036 RepID=UPI000D6DCD23|nr:ATP-binding protein [Reichenbachiella versicolor]
MLQQLKEIETLAGVPDEELQWLIDQSEKITYQKDDLIFKSGDPNEHLLIILEGQVVLKIQQGNQFKIASNFGKNTITGLLPYSRATNAIGTGVATEKVVLLSLSKSKFKDMIVHQETLTTALVHVMSTRIREFTKRQQLDDKMMSLGKLSAGLAHELNNPSAAIVRSAQTLSQHLKILPDNFKEVIKIEMTNQQVDTVNEILFSKIGLGPQVLSMMEKSEREDDIIDWLDEREIEDSEELAENLVDFGFEIDELDTMCEGVEEGSVPIIFRWIDQNLTTERIVSEIEEASQRINKLVTSIKSYTHMDQAPEKVSTDIHIGIENTLTMLHHKLEKSGITIHRDFSNNIDKPKILVSEMNQVWTNLIDNAVDAMEFVSEKILTVKSYQDGEFINVVIGDTGSGIPLEVQDKIFDPFFTTKEIGKGTGLGMEVVHRIIKNQHNGSITFTTKPGKTEFKVCFPILKD